VDSAAAGPRTGGAAFSPGAVLDGRFVVVRFIARGGMGEVYEAQDRELSENVAVKVLRREIARDEDALERFKREIRTARKVTHRNVCRVFDVFRHREPGEKAGIAFVVMELLAGETLAEHLKKVHRLGPAEAMPIVRQMCAALGAAHAAGIIHRDFKSGNVMLSPSSEDPGAIRVVVTDFGLARARSGGEAGDSLTGTGDIVGTPAYMAPEQVEGGPITEATDIYALGVVLYEIVTGERPFSGDTPLSTALRRLKEPAPSPSDLTPDLDPAWVAVIRRCLERSPGDRFAGAADVVAALEGQSVPPVPQARVELPPATRRWLAAAIGAILLLAAFLAYWRLATRPSGRRGGARRAVAVLGFKNLSGRPETAWLSTAFAEMLRTELAAGEKLRTIPGEEIARVKTDLALSDADSLGRSTLTRVRKAIGSDLVVLGAYLDVPGSPGGVVRLDMRVQDAVSGEILASIAETGSEARLPDLVARAGSDLRGKLGLGRLSPGEASVAAASLPSSPVAERLYAEGLDRLRLFDALGARDLLDRAAAAEPGHPLVHSALAAAWSALGDDARARAQAQKALDLSGGLSREEKLSVEGELRQISHEHEKATTIYQTLFQFFPDNLDYGLRLAAAQVSASRPKDALATARTLRTLPLPAGEDPRIDLAEADAAQTLADYRRQLSAATAAGKKASDSGLRLIVARARFQQGVAQRSLGNWPGALAAFERARSAYEAVGDRLRVAEVTSSVASTYRDQGKAAEARKIYEDALAIFRQVGNAEGVANTINCLAILLRHQGDRAGAIRMFDIALSEYRRIDDSSGIAMVLQDKANAMSDQGDPAGARLLYEEALARNRQIGDRRGIATCLGNISIGLSDQGDLSKAIPMYREALGILRQIGDRHGVADALNNLAGMLYQQGDLAGARKMYAESLAACREIGDPHGVGAAQVNLGEILATLGELAPARASAEAALAGFRRLEDRASAAYALSTIARIDLWQARLPEARKGTEEALSLRIASGEQGTAAASRLALAEIAGEEGDASRGEALARQAREEFRREKLADDEALACAILARLLLAQHRFPDARIAAAQAARLGGRSQNRAVALSAAIAAARVRAAGGDTSDVESAAGSLEEAGKKAAAAGLREIELEARLARVEIGGSPKAAQVLAREAEKAGFVLISRKARAPA
jgi:tetratricopeptide (TPR) repeat protein/tRNA A-37 threonylcarbamoyl transferase component Bud32/TolB-like protein